MPYIYKISNDINDKLYIGKTLYTIERRWNQHKNNALSRKDLTHLPLYSAMNKYGIEHFSISEVEKVDDENNYQHENSIGLSIIIHIIMDIMLLLVVMVYNYMTMIIFGNYGNKEILLNKFLH